ncbi:MAG TPA: hypothetical protein VMA34_13700, partial [Terracidiphilus sp.]|nr:hypothetical protein [Terracidiphilus sp.]
SSRPAGRSDRKRAPDSESASEGLMPRYLCGKLAINPKKQGEIAENAGELKANARRINRAPQDVTRSSNYLKLKKLFSQTFFLDTAFPRTYYAARKF